MDSVGLLFTNRENRMYRKIMEDLKKWKKSPHRKPLILQGARQIGKTWAMMELGRLEYENTAYLFCQENQVLERLFDAPFDKERLLNGFQIICGFKIKGTSKNLRVRICQTPFRSEKRRKASRTMGIPAFSGAFSPRIFAGSSKQQVFRNALNRKIRKVALVFSSDKKGLVGWKEAVQ